MIINNFDIIGIVALPDKTDAPLLIDSNTKLSFSIAVQCFQKIGWRNTQGFKKGRCVQHFQLYGRSPPNRLGQLCGKTALKEFFSFLGFERLDHENNIILPGYYRQEILLKYMGGAYVMSAEEAVEEAAAIKLKVAVTQARWGDTSAPRPSRSAGGRPADEKIGPI